MRPNVLAAAVAAGGLLLAFQNCSPGMASSQSFQNELLHENRQVPERDSELMGIELLEAAKQTLAVPVCSANDIRFSWPLGGTAFKDWMVYNYVDLDIAAGQLRDYVGNTGTSAIRAHTFDGHRGLDIDIANFRKMDSDVPVYAAADGVVEAFNQGSADRNLSCVQDPWNFIRIRHSTGIKTIYGHLKRNSVRVAVGQAVVRGQHIASVGSSGCSTYPHLHFEVVSCQGQVWDPMILGMMLNPPVYTASGPATLMDTVIKQPNMTAVQQMIDPGADPASVRINQVFSAGLAASAIKRNSVVRLDVVKPDGTMLYSWPFTVPTYYPLSNRFWNMSLSLPGEYTLKYFVDNQPIGERKVLLTP